MRTIRRSPRRRQNLCVVRKGILSYPILSYNKFRECPHFLTVQGALRIKNVFAASLGDLERRLFSNGDLAPIWRLHLCANWRSPPLWCSQRHAVCSHARETLSPCPSSASFCATGSSTTAWAWLPHVEAHWRRWTRTVEQRLLSAILHGDFSRTAIWRHHLCAKIMGVARHGGVQ